MKSFIFPRFVIITKLPEKEVRKRITRITDLSTGINWDKYYEGYNKKYEGNFIDDQSFCISRVIRNTNSFLPLIRGSITVEKEYTMVRLNMTLTPVIIAITMSFLIVCMLIAVGGIVVSLYFEFFPITIAPLVLLTLFCIAGIFILKYESRKDLNYLAKLLDATVVHNNS